VVSVGRMRWYHEASSAPSSKPSRSALELGQETWLKEIAGHPSENKASVVMEGGYLADRLRRKGASKEHYDQGSQVKKKTEKMREVGIRHSYQYYPTGADVLVAHRKGEGRYPRLPKSLATLAAAVTQA